MKSYKNIFFGTPDISVYFLEKLKDFDFVPKIYSYDDKNLTIEMEKIDGITIQEIFEKGYLEEIKKVVSKVIDICFLLDKMGIQKEEMNRPYRHIIVQGERVVFIDWERAHEKKNPSNLTQFIEYLYKNKEILERKGFILPEREEMIKLMKEYKKSYSEEVVKKIKEKLKL